MADWLHGFRRPKNYKNSDEFDLNSAQGIVFLWDKSPDGISHIVSNIGSYELERLPMNAILLKTALYKKKFDLYDSSENVLESGITFDLVANKVLNSTIFKSYKTTGYYLQNKYKMEINSIMYLLHWENENIVLEYEGKVRYILMLK